VRVVALDYGSARCGYAVSDPTGVLASPAGVVNAPSSRRGLARIGKLVDELGAQRVIVGLPLTLAGGESAQTREARAFAARLGERLHVPVECYDERFTTKLAARDGGTAPEDARAAAHLLQSWLDARSAVEPSGQARSADGAVGD
jgi:putative Holliday junction resolvase